MPLPTSSTRFLCKTSPNLPFELRRPLVQPAALLFCALSFVCACGGGPHATAPPPKSTSETRGPPIRFAYGTTQGTVFSSTESRGRATAVLFVTTFDLVSQAVARTLNDTVRRHRPRANALAVVLEVPKYAVLAESFRQSLGLVYPVALADADTLSGRGPFGPVRVVPTLVVLDRKGRRVWQKVGLVSASELSRALSDAGS